MPTAQTTRRVRPSPPDVAARRAAALAVLPTPLSTTAEARAAGLTPADLRSNAVVTVRDGVHVSPGHPLTAQVRIAAALRAQPHVDARIAHVSAATVLGLPAPKSDRIHLSYPRLPRHQLVGTVAHRHAVGSRTVDRLADPLAESPMESRLRLLLVVAGLPTPVAQHEVVVAGRRRRFDLAYPELGVAVEYDGSHHYATEAQKQADLLREDELRAEGWIVIRVVSHGIFRDPASTVRRVAEALRQRGLHLDTSEEWRPHFPQLA